MPKESDIHGIGVVTCNLFGIYTIGEGSNE